jgi:hypothetical protein
VATLTEALKTIDSVSTWWSVELEPEQAAEALGEFNPTLAKFVRKANNLFPTEKQSGRFAHTVTVANQYDLGVQLCMEKGLNSNANYDLLMRNLHSLAYECRATTYGCDINSESGFSYTATWGDV